MELWRRTTQFLLVGFCASLLSVGCSGSDGDGSIQEGTEPQLNVTPETVTFSNIEVNQSDVQTIEISNEGGAPLRVSNIQIDENDEDDRREFVAGESWQEDATIAPDDPPLELDVVYAPGNSTSDTGAVTFETDDEPEFEVPLEPEKLEPRVSAPDPVNFSSAPPGERVWRKFSIENVGEASLNISRLQLSGSELYQLTIPKEDDGSDDEKDGDKDGDQDMDEALKPMDDRQVDDVLPVTLEPGKSLTVRGWFEPEDNNPEDATLTIFSNAPEGRTKITLIGNSKAPCLGLSHEEKLEFEKSSIGKVARETVTMENCRPQSQKQLEVKNIEITDDDGGAFGLEQSSLPQEIQDGNSFELAGGDRKSFRVTFTPQSQDSYQGELLIESNDPTRTEQTIELTGSGTDNECPSAVAEGKVKGTNRTKTSINTLPLETIVFDGANSSDPDGSVKRYEWSIIDRPEDSTARLTPNSNVEKPKLFLDLAGTYRVELVVYDDEDIASCGEQQAIVEISAVPDEDIHVQLVWGTAADSDQSDSDGTDLDLHYLNPKASSWNEAPWDIFWNHKTADWGQENVPDDDPSLDIDDVDGAGPENINHHNPRSGSQYTVGVYYYDDHGFGPSYATVRIYINGILAREYKNKFMSGTFDFWKVARIEWPTGNIYPRDEKFTGFPNTNTD